MKSRQLPIAIILVLLLVPAITAVESRNASLLAAGSADHASISPVPALLPTSQIQLSFGQAYLVGSVNVRSLPQTSLSNTSMTIMPIFYPQGPVAFDQGKNETVQPGYVPTGESSKVVATSPAVSQTLSASVNLVLQGASGGSPNPCGCTPPDPNNAVGPKHVFEMVNLAGIIYLKNGTLAKSTFPLSAFFNTSSSMSDPRVLYDAISGRWFASIIDISNDNILIAVSASSDPTGDFKLYSVSPGINLPDQPYIGTSDDKFVIAANDFASASGPFVGVQYWIMNKAEMVSGSSTVQFATNTPDSSMFTLRPVLHLSSTSQFYLATDCTGSCVSDRLSTTSSVELVTVNGVPPGTVAVATQTFGISTSTSPPNAVQPGTRTLLATNDNRILSAVWESGTLWLSWSDACVPSGDRTTRSCVHLVEASVSGDGTATKNQDFDYASSGAYLFFPALSLYHGQLAVVYGKSSSSLFPSLFVTGRIPGDPVNSLETPATIRTGTVDDLSTRYGDYFGAGTDPTPTENSTFWVSGEYRASLTNSNWSTAIAQVGSFAPDFTISASPSSITMQAGIAGNSTLTVTGYKLVGNVNLNVTTSPKGLTCSLNPSVVVLATSPTSMLTCKGPSGSYNATITGASGSIVHSLIIPLTVLPSGTVGGIIQSVDRAEILLSYATPVMIMLTVFLVGGIVFWRSRGKTTHIVSREQVPRTLSNDSRWC